MTLFHSAILSLKHSYLQKSILFYRFKNALTRVLEEYDDDDPTKEQISAVFRVAFKQPNNAHLTAFKDQLHTMSKEYYRDNPDALHELAELDFNIHAWLILDRNTHLKIKRMDKSPTDIQTLHATFIYSLYLLESKDLLDQDYSEYLLESNDLSVQNYSDATPPQDPSLLFFSIINSLDKAGLLNRANLNAVLTSPMFDKTERCSDLLKRFLKEQLESTPQLQQDTLNKLLAAYASTEEEEEEEDDDEKNDDSYIPTSRLDY